MMMAETTQIEWADATWNPWHGCIKISPGCKHCYMYRDKKIYGQDPFVVARSKTTFNDPLDWQRGVGLKGKPKPKFIFTCSWSDFFISTADPWRAEAWRIMRATPEFTYLVLTKRAERMRRCLPADWGQGYPNVWLGVSAESQPYADARIPLLLQTPAVKHFLSAEPLLGPINLHELDLNDVDRGGDILSSGLSRHADRPGLDWVIAGGESGANVARPMEISWARSMRDQCVRARVPFFFKQWGEWAPRDAVRGVVDLRLKTYDKHRDLYKVGVDAAGNLLDNQQWLERPAA